jgi:hypothetical protein
MGLLDEAIREHLALKRGRGADPAEIAREEKDALGPPTRTPEPQAARVREERGEPEYAALDEPATAFAPGDDAPQAGSEQPGEPRLRLATRDEPRPVPEGREDGTTGEPPPAEPRLRITEEELGEYTAGAGTSPLPPSDDAPLEFTDDELHTDDFVFDDEDDFFADEPPEPPPAPQRSPDVSEPEPHDVSLGDDPEAGPLDQPTQQYALEDVEEITRPPESPPLRSPDAGEEDEPEGEELLEETPEFLEETPEHDRLWFEQKPPRDFDF